MQDALINADKAGDVDAARQLADAIVATRKTQEAKPASVKAGSMVNDIGRQLGLTARYGIEGLGQSAEILSEPFRYVTDRLTGSVGKTKSAGRIASDLANTLGLPTPQGSNERVIGDASKMVSGAMALGGGAQKLAQYAEPVAAKTLSFLAANPAQQSGAAAGAGLAGGSSREAGGTDLQQGLSALLGGVGGGLATSGAMAFGQGATNLGKQMLGRGMTLQQMDIRISGLLRQSGVDYDAMPERVKQSLRSQLQSALNTNREIDPAALSRLAAFQEAGITPTRGMVSQNPVQITKEMNLAKMGANTSDEGLQGLALIQNQNNARLIQNMNQLGANQGSPLRAGETVANSILRNQAGLRNAERTAWEAAKTSPGYKQQISAGVLSRVNSPPDEGGLIPFMGSGVSKFIDAFQNGAPINPPTYKNLMSILSKETSKGGNEAAAAALARRVLMEADLAPAGFAAPSGSLVTQGTAAGMRATDNAVDSSIDAINRARQATATAYGYEDSSPLVRTVLSEGAMSDPQRIANRFIVGGTAREAADVLNQVGPQGAAQVKNAVLSHLKTKALNRSSDEVGKFSQSAFNSALDSIGERKLSIIFSPEELRALRLNGRVASLMQSQPVGSAVNNSNSGAMVAGLGFDALQGLAGKLPFGKAAILDPLSNITTSINTRAAQNIMPGLLREQPKLPIYQPFLLPAAAAGGLLSAP